MTVLNLQVLASLDDAYENEDSGAIFEVSVWVTVISSPTTGRAWAGLRWPYGSLARGDLINSCTLQLYVLAGDANLDIYFQKVAAPLAFSGTNGDITDRARTTASVAWVENSMSGWKTSADLKDVLQEVLDSFKPAALVIICKPKTDLNKTLATRSYNFDPTLAAKLDIDYTSRSISYPTAGISAKRSEEVLGGRAGVADRIPGSRASAPPSPIAMPAQESGRVPPARVRRQQEL